MSRNRIIYPESLPSGFFPKDNPMYFSAVAEVCQSLRADEIAQHMQFFAAGAAVEEYSPRIAAVGVINLGGIAFFGLDQRNAKPYVVGGYAPDAAMEGVWQSWMIGTQSGWDRNWKSITAASRWMISKLFEGGARRLETTCIASRKEAQEWYSKFLGLRLEGERHAYCPNGESLMMYGLTREQFYGQFE